MTYSLIDIIENPNRLKSLPLYSYLDFLENAASENKEMFSNYMKRLSSCYPAIFRMILMGFRSHIVPLRLVFSEELSGIPVHVKRNISDVNVFRLFSELSEYLSSGNIMNIAYRKRFIDKMVGSLSDEEYQFFVRILRQGYSEAVETRLLELWNDNDFPEMFAKNFMFVYKHETYREPERFLFGNSSKTEFLSYMKNEPSRFFVWGNLFIRLDAERKPHSLVSHEEDVYNKLYSFSRGGICYVVTDFLNCYGKGDMTSFVLSSPQHNAPEVFVESALCDILTEQPHMVFILDKNGVCEYTFSRNDVLKKTSLKIDSFSTIDCPFTGGKFKILNAVHESGTESLIGKIEDISNLGKKKSLSFIEFNGTKYLTT